MDTHSQINGYLVVRKPEFNRDALGRGSYTSAAPCIGNTYYSGIDRMDWFDVAEQLYSDGLPSPIKNHYDTIKKNNDDFSGILVCQDLDIALELLHFSNSFNNENEIIAVFSDKLSTLKGTIALLSAEITWIGYDVVVLGGHSLLHEGVFSATDLFPGWPDRVNEFGLFDTHAICDEFVMVYMRALKNGAFIEDWGLARDSELGPEYGIDFIAVGRLNVD